ncbi:hypothetical protein V6N11_058857 [Hibiscus sabdariffa]|uniref:Reverse transcriptase n=1 Tax=Hibiscus sabdariffa TaxID=183260 RepID=A0ABR2U5H0_9ROSI
MDDEDSIYDSQWEDMVDDDPDSGHREVAAISEFRRIFNLFRRTHHPYVVALFKPQIHGAVADKVISHLGYPNSFHIESLGFSGGIWLMWDSSVTMEISHIANQFIHGMVRSVDSDTWSWFTAVYACSQASRRRHLWRHLESLNPGDTEPWVLGSDFNSILGINERIGGSLSNACVSSTFNQFILDMGLIDLGFKGPPFTWSRARPFRFIGVWQEHLQFLGFLESIWKSDKSLPHNICKFQSEVQGWNRDIFGHIGQRKHRVLACLRGIDKMFWDGSSWQGGGLLMLHIRELLRRPWDVRLQHGMRARNSVADAVSKLAQRSDFAIQPLAELSSSLVLLLQADMVKDIS